MTAPSLHVLPRPSLFPPPPETSLSPIHHRPKPLSDRLLQGLATILVPGVLCAGCAPPPRPPLLPYLHIPPAILVLAQQAEIAHLERGKPAALSTPTARVDRQGRLDLVIGYRGPEDAALHALQAIGARIVAHPAEGHWIEAWIPARHVASLARVPGVVSVRFPSRARERI